MPGYCRDFFSLKISKFAKSVEKSQGTRCIKELGHPKVGQNWPFIPVKIDPKRRIFFSLFLHLDTNKGLCIKKLVLFQVFVRF